MKNAVTTFMITLGLLQAHQAQALPIGIPDTFETSVENWFAGGAMGQFPPDPPIMVPDGGPSGAGDGFMQVTSNGTGGPGGRLVAMNRSQWAGDYTTIAGIQMDVRNLGQTELTLRLYLENPIPGPPTDDAVSLPTVVLPVGGDWQSVFFPLDMASLILLNGDLGNLLPAVTVLRLMHNPDAGFPPPQIAALLGVDNIVAVAAPEPAVTALLVVAAAGWASRRRRRLD